MNKSAIVGTALLCVALAAGAGFWFGAQRANGPGDAPAANATAKGTAPVGTPMVVEATKVVRQALPQTITAVGSLRSDESVTLRPEVAGRVNAILFKEGQNVSKGMPTDARKGGDPSAARSRIEMHRRVPANIDLHGIGC